MPQKLKSNIFLGKDYDFDILHEVQDSSVEIIKKAIRAHLSRLENFYSLRIKNLTIELIYTREEFNEIVGRKTPAWMVALSKDRKIYIFTPQAVKEHSSHEKPELEKTIVHELVHIFNSRINPDCPAWIDEGLALYLADQKKDGNFSQDNWQYFLNHFLENNIDLDDFARHDGYKISYNLVKRIIKNHDKNTLIQILHEK